MEVIPMSPNHRIKATGAKKKPVDINRASPAAPAWPSYQGTSQFVGTSPTGRVTVYVDPTIGQPGLQNAQDLLNDADRVVGANDAIFGTTGGPVSVIVFALGNATEGTGVLCIPSIAVCAGCSSLHFSSHFSRPQPCSPRARIARSVRNSR